MKDIFEVNSGTWKVLAVSFCFRKYLLFTLFLQDDFLRIKSTHEMSLRDFEDNLKKLEEVHLDTRIIQDFQTKFENMKSDFGTPK
jgi:hypothetical protein